MKNNKKGFTLIELLAVIVISNYSPNNSTNSVKHNR